MSGLLSTLKHVGKHFTTKKRYDTASQWRPELGSLYDLKASDLDGRPYDLSQLKGKTKCGYQFLEEEQQKYASRGFTVLAFPCNQFGGQEPGGPQDIRDFAVKSFHATFPLLEKTDVNGPGTHPVFAYLKAVYPGEVTWNFHGLFVVNEDGVPIRRFFREPYPEIDAFIGAALDDRDKAAAAPAAAPGQADGHNTATA